MRKLMIGLVGATLLGGCYVGTDAQETPDTRNRNTCWRTADGSASTVFGSRTRGGSWAQADQPEGFTVRATVQEFEDPFQALVFEALHAAPEELDFACLQLDGIVDMCAHTCAAGGLALGAPTCCIGGDDADPEQGGNSGCEPTPNDVFDAVHAAQQPYDGVYGAYQLGIDIEAQTVEIFHHHLGQDENGTFIEAEVMVSGQCGCTCTGLPQG